MSLNSAQSLVFVMEKEGVCCEVGIVFLGIIYNPQTSQSVVNKQRDLPVRDCDPMGCHGHRFSLVPPFLNHM